MEVPTLPAHSCEQKGSRSEAGNSKKEAVRKRPQWHPRCLSSNPTCVRILEESWAYHGKMLKRMCAGKQWLFLLALGLTLRLTKTCKYLKCFAFFNCRFPESSYVTFVQEMKEKQTRLYAALQNVCQPSTLSSELYIQHHLSQRIQRALQPLVHYEVGRHKVLIHRTPTLVSRRGFTFRGPVG